MTPEPTPTKFEQAFLSLQQVSDGFQKLATAAELADPLREFRVAALEAERAERRRKLDAKETRRRRHRGKTAAVAFLYEPEP